MRLLFEAIPYLPMIMVLVGHDACGKAVVPTLRVGELRISVPCLANLLSGPHH
jgi:hypothetical protein